MIRAALSAEQQSWLANTRRLTRGDFEASQVARVEARADAKRAKAEAATAAAEAGEARLAELQRRLAHTEDDLTHAMHRAAKHRRRSVRRKARLPDTVSPRSWVGDSPTSSSDCFCSDSSSVQYFQYIKTVPKI